MDAGIIRCLKAHYRRQLLLKILNSLDENREFTPTLFMAVQLLSQAWSSIEESTIRNCFHHCGFISSPLLPQPSTVPIPYQDLDNIFEKMSRSFGLPASVKAADYLSVDDCVSICAPSTDSDIIETIKPLNPSLFPDSVDCDDTDTVDDSASLPHVKLSEAIQAVETIQLFLSQQNIDGEDFC
jgi:hypothetical protein